MAIQKLLDAVTIVGASAKFNAQGASSIVVHIDISAAGTSATVVVKGRVDPSMPYFIMASKTATDVFEVPPVSDLIIEVTEVTGKTISASVQDVRV